MKPKPSAEQALRHSWGWLEASIFQGRRLTDLLDAQVAKPVHEFTEEDWRAHSEANDLPDGGVVEFYESYFLMCALRQARRWLQFATGHWPTIRAEVDVFLEATAHVDDVRDMVTHEDEYLVGAGKAQDRYAVQESYGFTVNAHSLVATGMDDYLIGGRVSLPKTMQALRAFRPALVALCREHLKDG